MAHTKLGASPRGQVQEIALMLLNRSKGASVMIRRIAKASETKPAIVREKLGASWRHAVGTNQLSVVPEYNRAKPFDLLALHLSASVTALPHAQAMVERSESRAANQTENADAFASVVAKLEKALKRT